MAVGLSESTRLRGLRSGTMRTVSLGNIDADNNGSHTTVFKSTPGGGEGPVVPEPGTIAIWGVLAAIGAVVVRRRKA